MERAPETASHSSRSLAFIDTGVADWRTIADALPTGTRVVQIAPGSDALKQITDVINQSQNLETVSFISYGSEGKLSLGSGFDQKTLEANRDEITSWSSHFASDGQILLWACDTGEGANGQSLVNSLHDLTRTDVAASSNAVGVSAEGGDWTLESKSREFIVHDVFGASGVAGYHTVLDQAQPTVTLSHSDSVVPVGGTFTETISFSNTASNAVGYGPYIAVLEPKTEGKSAALQSLTYLGNPMTLQRVSVSDTISGHEGQLGVNNPYVRDANGKQIFIEAPSGASVGDNIVFSQLPFGSYSPGQPAAAIQAVFKVDATASVGSATLPISALGGFYLGQDAQNNPSVDAPISGTAVTDPLDTSLVTVRTISQTTTATDNAETATGSDFPITYTTTITPAPATKDNNAPIKNFQTVITLPSNTVYLPGSTAPQVLYADGTVVPDAQVTLVSSDNGYGAKFSVTIPSLDASATNVRVSLQAYVPQNNADGSSVLGNSGASANVAAPDVTYSADDWTSGNGTQVPVSGNGDTSSAVVTAKSVALQNSSQDITTGNTPGYVLPTDTIRYTAAIQTSDFNALSKPVITQDIDDGQTIDPASSPVFTYSVKGGAKQTLNLGTIDNASTQTINGDNVYVSGSNNLWSFERDSQTGHTIARFDIGKAIADGLLPAGATGSLTYQAKALTHYANGTATTGTLLAGSDALRGTDSVQGDYANADGSSPTDTSQIGDGGQTGLVVPNGNATIKVVAVNGASADASAIRPGDQVTYALTYSMLSGNYNNLHLTSYLPQQVYSVTDPTQAGGNGTSYSQSDSNSGFPPSGQYALVSAPKGVSISGGATASAGSNSLDFGLSQSSETPGNSAVTIYFTTTASNAPMADGLPLTNMVQGALINGGGKTVVSQQIAGARLAEPALNTVTGIVSVVDDGGNAKSLQYTNQKDGTVVDPSTVFSKAGTTGNPFVKGAPDASSAIDNLDMIAINANASKQINGGDTIRVATTVSNTGAYAAYDVFLAGVLPSGITVDDVSNFQVIGRDSDGNQINYSTDKSAYFSSGGARIIATSANDPVLYATGDADHRDLLTVIYDIKLPQAVVLGQTLQNTGLVAAFSNRAGGDNFVDGTGSDPAGDTLTDSAQAVLASPTITLSTKYPAYNSPTGDAGTNVVPGETREITAVVSIPEGQISNNGSNVTITVPLPKGMIVLPGSKVTVQIGDPNSSDSSSASYDSSAVASADGKTLTVSLGTSVSNTSDDSKSTYSAKAVTVDFKATFPDGQDDIGAAPDTTYDTVSQLIYSGGPVGSNSLRFTQIDPDVVGTLTSDGGTAMYSGQTVTYTYSLQNNGKSIAEDLTQILSLSNLTLVSGSASVQSGSGVSITENSDGTLTIGGVNNALSVGAKTVFTFQAKVKPGQAAGTADTVSTQSGSYNSMPSQSTVANANSSTGHKFSLAASVSNTIDTYKNLQLTIVGESNGNQASESSPQTSVTTPIGDIVRLKGSVDIPKGSNHIELSVSIPAGVTIPTNDVDALVGDMRVAFLSTSGQITSSTLDKDGTNSQIQVKENGSRTDPANVTPTAKVNADFVKNSVKISNGYLVIDFGTVSNDDSTSVANQIIFEFNGIIANTSANTASGKTANTEALYIGDRADAPGIGGAPSAPVTQTVVEPSISMTQVQTGFDTATATATYTVTLTNNGTSPAYRVQVNDPLGDNTTYVSGSYTGSADNTVTSDTSGLHVSIGSIGNAAGSNSISYTYQVQLTDKTKPSATHNSTVTYEGLVSASPQTLNDTTGDKASSATGGRTGVSQTDVNNYVDTESVGLSVVSGQLFQALGIKGAVPSYDSRLDTPLANVTVTATAGKITETTQTDANGNFTFYGLPNGQVTITAPQTANSATSSQNLPAYETNIYVTSGIAGSAISKSTAAGNTMPDVSIVYRLPDQAPVIANADQSTVLTQNAGVAGAMFHTSSGATSAVTASDAELDKLISVDASTYSYSGSVLTVQRYQANRKTPAPNANDVYGGQNGLTLSNGSAILGGVTIGTYTVKSGVLALTFGSGTTSQTVTSVLQNLTYASTATSTDQTLTTLGVTIDDHNNAKDNAQGTGGIKTSTPVFTVFNTVATKANNISFDEPNNSAASTAASQIPLPALSGNASISKVSLSLTGAASAGEDHLAFTASAATGNITSVYDAASGTLTLSSANNTATQVQWNKALQAISYYDSSDTPSTGTRMLTRTVTLSNSNVLTQSNAVTIAVAAHDDSPVLDTTKPVALVSVSENQSGVPGLPSGAVGTLVSALINAQTVIDPDANNIHDGSTGSVPGMVITGASTQFGSWYYTVDNGAHWLAFNASAADTVSSTNGLFLLADSQTRVAFVPTAQNFNGSIPNALTYRAWDQYDPHANGSFASLPTIGSFGSGTDAAASYSSALQTLPQTVIALNNAPIANGKASLGDGTEGQPAPVKSVAQLFGAQFSDTADAQKTADNPTGSEANTLAGIALVSNPTPDAEGHWSYSTDGGKTWIFIPTDLSETNALVLGSNTLLTYQAPPDFNGAPQPLNAHLIDSSSQIPVYGAVTGEALAGTSTAQRNVDISKNQGGDSAVSLNTVPLGTAVSAVNDAPIVTGNATLANGTEDQGPESTGQSIGSLFDTKFSDRADQQQTADNPTGSQANTLAGIAIVSNTTPVSEGQWVYSTDNGKTWLPVGSVSDSNALVLSRDIKLSFSPSANFNGQPAPLGERLIDSSATQVFGTTTGAMIAQGGIVQQGVDVTSNGGTTAVSAGQSSLGVTVASVNDAPVVSTDQAGLPASIEHGPVVSESVLTLFGNNFDDTADQQQSEANPAGSTANILAGIAITGNTTPSSEGAWRYSIDGGKTWVAVGTVSPHSALVLNANALLTFTPAPNYNGIPMPLSAHLIDSSTMPVFGATTGAFVAQNNVAQPGVDVTSNGGITAISSASVDLSTSVTAVHSSPRATSNVAFGTGTEDDGPVSGKSVDALFSSSFDSSADRQRTPQNPTGSVESHLAGIIVSGNPTPVSEGFWRYSIDGGKTWTAVGQVSAANALVLSKSALLDFAPASDFNGAPMSLQVHLVDDSTEQATTSMRGSDIAALATARHDYVPLFGGESAVSADIIGIETIIAPVNDAPIATGMATLPAGMEDQTPVAQSVATLFGSNFDDSTDQQLNVNNPAGSEANILAGIAITANTTPVSEGVWRYSTDGGKTWTAIGTVSDASALVMSADTLLSFVPAPDFNGQPPPLTAHLIDSSTVSVFGTTTGAMIAQGGLVQSGVDIRDNGGTTPISVASVDLNTAIVAVNDAPVAKGSATLPTGMEDMASPAQNVATLFGASFNDAADQQQSTANPTGSLANTFAGIAITANPTPVSEGVWRYSTDGGQTWTSIGTVSDSSALVLSADVLLSFAPAPDFNGAPLPLSAHLIDSSAVPVFGRTTGQVIAQGGVAQSNVDVSQNGGTMAVSASTVDLNTSIAAIPDAPTASGVAFLPGITQDGVPQGQTVETLFGPGYGNTSDQQQTAINPTGSVSVPIAGVAIVGNPTPTSEGSWVYSTDGGQHWISIPTSIDPAHALILPKDVLIAFAPAPDFNGAPLPLDGRPIATNNALITPGLAGNALKNVVQNIDLSNPDPNGAVALDAIPLNTTVQANLLRPEVMPGDGNINVPNGGGNLHDLISDRFTDFRRNQKTALNPTGSTSDVFGGIVITANPTQPSEGSWRYTTDGGKSWVVIPVEVSPQHAFVVPANATIMFQGSGTFTGSATLEAHLLRNNVATIGFLDTGTGPFGHTSAQALFLTGTAAAQDVGARFGLPRLTTDTLREGFSASALAEPVVQAWLGPYEKTGLTDTPSGWLRGTDRQAFVLVQTQDAVSIAGVFDSSGPLAALEMRATQKNGAPLPDWIIFDPLTGCFTVVAPIEAPDFVDLKVEARDTALRFAESSIRITIGRDPMLELLGNVPELASPTTLNTATNGHRPLRHQLLRAAPSAQPIPGGRAALRGRS
ncbi:DUF4347 domain-containing protein [Asaia siamensis]|uniref:DUF4347 domain-containing protein n=1 Tax=Asaia siamensis TaxID=110479 RepID=UPI00227C81B7|nr:DUF4347 domain-containing protein [Asaia siamensis]